jgi:AcrR family transcriptional regulator
MPRLPDAELEAKIVAAAMRLLDRGGESSITLRSVAKEAGTTTPTIYQRFRNREDLMKGVVRRATTELMDVLEPASSIEGIFRIYLRDVTTRPNRMGLMVETFGSRYAAGEEMPAFELLQSHIAEEIGVKGRECEDLALAIASLGFGTAQGMIAAGSDSTLAGKFQRSALHALRMLLGAFSRRRKGRVPARQRYSKKPRRN